MRTGRFTDLPQSGAHLENLVLMAAGWPVGWTFDTEKGSI